MQSVCEVNYSSSCLSDTLRCLFILVVVVKLYCVTAGGSSGSSDWLATKMAVE